MRNLCIFLALILGCIVTSVSYAQVTGGSFGGSAWGRGGQQPTQTSVQTRTGQSNTYRTYNTPIRVYVPTQQRTSVNGGITNNGSSIVRRTVVVVGSEHRDEDYTSSFDPTDGTEGITHDDIDALIDSDPLAFLVFAFIVGGVMIGLWLSDRNSRRRL
jgi:hypothetical protein